MENRIRPAWVIILLLSGLLLGLYINKGVGKRQVTFEGGSKFDEVMWYVDNDYVEKPDAQKLQDEAIAAMMEKLDPHSAFISLDEFNEVNDPLLGSFDGIGVQFRLEKDTIAIVNVIKGGPSEKVGIMAGDRIIYVDDTLVASKKLKNEDVMRKLKGPKNTKVRVRVLRRGVEGLLDYTITRDAIPTYSVDIAYMLDKNIGYLKLSKFSATTADEFKKGIRDLKAQGMQQLVFDLRGNTGGFLSAAVDIADEFLHKGSLIVYTEGRNRPRQYMKASRHGMLEDMPVVVLIDGESASASEIVAGALQDNDRGTIIGRRSFGKGLVQEQIVLSDNSAIRLTVARYYTPTGRCIQKPYSGDLEEYMLESLERYENGELFSEDSIHFADSLKYTTPKGKTVYGGGGIMPDIYVPLVNDSTEYYFNRIVNKGLLYQYAFEYTDKHRKQLQQYKTVKSFDQSFVVSDAMFDELVKLADEKGIKGTEEQRQVARREANTLLKAYIARNLFDDEGFYPIYASMDEVLQRALEELKTKNLTDR
ncbi:MAG: PDZ domain-containing protein [Muribaculaceae bacterium]|nr:PDZ domain-containing protein [Muribaculaceae bacterium]